MAASHLPHRRFVLFLALFGTTASLALPWLHWAESIILGFDLAALVFLASVVPLWNAPPLARTTRAAISDDGGRVLLTVVAVLLIAVILLALGRMVVGRAALTPADVGIVAATLVLAWTFAHMLFAFHYAHVYQDRSGEGAAPGEQGPTIRFPDAGPPGFSDFAYLSFVIGMTCQTADVDLAAPRLRRVAMLHGVFAFFFNLGVLSLMVNVLAGVM